MNRILKNNGFTLIEMVIIVIIIGTIAMAGFPALTSSLGDARLAGAVTEVVTALEYGRMEAMGSGRTTMVRIGHINNQIRIKKRYPTVDLLGSETQLAETDVEGGVYRFIQHPLKRGENYDIVFDNEERLRGVDITASDYGGDNQVFFEPDGLPDNGGSSTLALGARQKIVTLDAFTGTVTVSD